MSFSEWFAIAGKVLLTAMMPLLEVKASIPVGIVLGLPPWECFMVALIGSFIPCPIIIYFFRPVAKFLRTHGPLKKLISFVEKKAHKKSALIKKYRIWGLFLFVAVPLPGTGVWMGSLIATLLNLRIKHAMIAIFAGNVIASLCMLLLGTIVL